MSDIKINVQHVDVHIEPGDAVKMAFHAVDDVREVVIDKLRRLLGG